MFETGSWPLWKVFSWRAAAWPGLAIARLSQTGGRGFFSGQGWPWSARDALWTLFPVASAGVCLGGPSPFRCPQASTSLVSRFRAGWGGSCGVGSHSSLSPPFGKNCHPLASTRNLRVLGGAGRVPRPLLVPQNSAFRHEGTSFRKPHALFERSLLKLEQGRELYDLLASVTLILLHGALDGPSGWLHSS